MATSFANCLPPGKSIGHPPSLPGCGWDWRSVRSACRSQAASFRSARSSTCSPMGKRIRIVCRLGKGPSVTHLLLFVGAEGFVWLHGPGANKAIPLCLALRNELPQLRRPRRRRMKLILELPTRRAVARQRCACHIRRPLAGELPLWCRQRHTPCRSTAAQLWAVHRALLRPVGAQHRRHLCHQQIRGALDGGRKVPRAHLAMVRSIVALRRHHPVDVHCGTPPPRPERCVRILCRALVLATSAVASESRALGTLSSPASQLGRTASRGPRLEARMPCEARVRTVERRCAQVGGAARRIVRSVWS
jgi:hypothetical protein